MDAYERCRKDSSTPASPSVALIANQPAAPLLPAAPHFGLGGLAPAPAPAAAEEPAVDNDQHLVEHENASNDEEPPTHPLAHVKPLQHIRLQCLAARAINRHKVKYGPTDLPPCLVAMVKSHGD
jgi:hypothetical protein